MRGAEEELEGDSPKEKREEEEGEEEEERRKSAGEGKKEVRLETGETPSGTTPGGTPILWANPRRLHDAQLNSK